MLPRLFFVFFVYDPQALLTLDLRAESSPLLIGRPRGLNHPLARKPRKRLHEPQTSWTILDLPASLPLRLVALLGVLATVEAHVVVARTLDATKGI